MFNPSKYSLGSFPYNTHSINCYLFHWSHEILFWWDGIYYILWCIFHHIVFLIIGSTRPWIFPLHVYPKESLSYYWYFLFLGTLCVLNHLASFALVVFLSKPHFIAIFCCHAFKDSHSQYTLVDSLYVCISLLILMRSPLVVVGTSWGFHINEPIHCISCNSGWHATWS